MSVRKVDGAGGGGQAGSDQTIRPVIPTPDLEAWPPPPLS